MKKKILFLGVGGIGVSALAIAANKIGAEVSGYDSNPNKLTKKLEESGINIYTSPSGVDIASFDMVVYSSAILDSHPLLSEARSYGVQCLQRAMFLAILMKDFKQSVAVTGTHGKTTTSSILATLLCQLDQSSSFVVGGVVKHTDSNIEVNGADKLVIEADESDASFLHLNPNSAIVTNVDLDHMSTYRNSYTNLLDNFAKFLNKKSVKNIYLCIDDKGCRDLLAKYTLVDKKLITYGFSQQADIQIFNYSISDAGNTNFRISYKQQDLDFTIQLPGKYNVQNAVACIASCLDFGFGYEDIRRALIEVAGVTRRFDIYSKKISGHYVQVVDDYGHHPAEIAGCIGAVRDKYPNKKLIHVFQPHRYSRNKDLLNDWSKALCLSDLLIILPTYSAGEDIIKGAESQDIAKRVENHIVAHSFDHAIYSLEKLVDGDTVVLVQGAGDVTNIVEMIGE